eukprot:3576798-Alexandrium_andersonii.AAC.1
MHSDDVDVEEGTLEREMRSVPAFMPDEALAPRRVSLKAQEGQATTPLTPVGPAHLRGRRHTWQRGKRDSNPLAPRTHPCTHSFRLSRAKPDLL